jgi:hypothetical protein
MITTYNASNYNCMTEQKNKMQYFAPAEKRKNKIPHNDDTINDAEHEFYKSIIGQKGVSC